MPSSTHTIQCVHGSHLLQSWFHTEPKLSTYLVVSLFRLSYILRGVGLLSLLHVVQHCLVDWCALRPMSAQAQSATGRTFCGAPMAFYPSYASHSPPHPRAFLRLLIIFLILIQVISISLPEKLLSQ